MSVRGVDRLESRLRTHDLQLVDEGPHLQPERAALIATGSDPSTAEAAHVAACDDCVDLLVALGASFDRLALENPPLAALTVEPIAVDASRRAPRWPILLVAAACGATLALGAFWLARHGEAPMSPVPAETAAP
jgi:hypothetical protein